MQIKGDDDAGALQLIEFQQKPAPGCNHMKYNPQVHAAQPKHCYKLKWILIYPSENKVSMVDNTGQWASKKSQTTLLQMHAISMRIAIDIVPIISWFTPHELYRARVE